MSLSPTMEEELAEILADLEFGSDEIYDEVVRTLSADDNTALSITERFGNLPVFQNPQQLIYTDKENKLAINDQVMDQISSMDVPLNIVAICGIYRTGKSYLMNQLAQEKTGFSLGNTVASHTKGIWAWCKQHPTQSEQVLLLLDTEGLADAKKADTDHDNNMFCLTSLLSSTLIYNNSGVLDNDSLEKLSFITKMTQSIRLSETDTISTEDNEEIIQLVTPTFIMCLRDFFLDLEDGEIRYKDADEYFQSVLDSQGAEGQTQSEKTKSCIKKYFPWRKCFTASIPTTSKRLGKLETVPQEELDMDFVQDVIKLREFVYQQPPKILDAVTKKVANGPVFDAFARVYIKALAEGHSMTFTNAYEQASILHNSKLVVMMSHQYRQELDGLHIPYEKKDDLQNKCIELQRKKLRMFRQQFYPYKVDYFEEKAMRKMVKKQKAKMEENIQLVQQFLNEILQDLHHEIFKNFDEKYDKTFGLSFYKQDLEDFEMKFKQATKQYDADEQSNAFLAFKKSIKEEKLRVEFMAHRREEEERNEKLHREVQESLKSHFEQQLQEMKQEREQHLKEEIEKMKVNYTEAMGVKNLRGKSFLSKIMLLFSNS